MQTFSDMRRDIFDKNYLKAFFLALFIIGYESLSDIYYILPPLFGVAFILADEAYRKNNKVILFSLLIFLLLFEASKGYLFFSSVIFFYLSFEFILPMIRQFLVCDKCLVPIFIFYAYFGYYLFMELIGGLFRLPVPDFSTVIFYYAFIEALFLAILL